MVNASKEIEKWYRPGFVGIGTAWIYKVAVRALGCDAYKAAQKEQGNDNAKCD